MQVSAAGDIGKPIDAFSSTRWHSIETGRNIRTQFLYDNSIFPSIPSWPSWLSRFQELANAQPTYLTYRPSPTFYPANGRTLFVHIAANSLLTKESYWLFREFILNTLASSRTSGLLPHAAWKLIDSCLRA